VANLRWFDRSARRPFGRLFHHLGLD
jgi:hypothetical protein